LLASPHDEELFAYHAASELALVDSDREAQDTELAASRAHRFIGAPCIVSSFDVAPSGDLVLVTRVTQPFSYLHGVYGFPHSIEVWNLRGERVHVVADVPAADDIPIEGVRLGPRGVAWCPHEDATLVWVEALDGGDPRRSATHRDRWLEHAHPFDREPREIVRLEHRASHLSWMPDPGRVLAREYDRDRRWTRAAIYDRYDVRALRVVLDDRSQRDRYGDPGAIITRSTERGGRVVRQEGAWIFRIGEGESKEGARPFLDRQNLETLAIERVWRCEADAYESFFAFVEDEARRVDRFLTRHESPRDPPNLRLRSPAADKFRAITRFEDPAPELRGITKELVHYERDDGVALSGTLYLPAGYARTAPLPLVMWAYPRDFVDADTAGQVLETPNTFTRIAGASHLFFLTQGYAVLDGASMPIIGDPGTMNDTFIEQSVAAARAAIEKLADLGLCDRSRVGIGGHSYGAFMAANLLAHCDLFRAGIARSGAYNRTLTPFGFQAERRSLWEARSSYVELSPLMHADKIKAPLLLIHGADDDNPGTFPLQSERLFHALKGNGGTARYVELPHESHGYRARESVLHVLHEMFEWFDRFVKHADVP
jgi:dipeptidyl aminopeptidase/acylaminoacyl peptidase